ncbi:MAG: hypothetical protein ACFFD1_13595 [Candidatus Thorarchaeota archaeon]
MEKLFVPIDFSDVANVIPKGEDIIYSSFCSGQWMGADLALSSPGKLAVSGTFQSHVLFTKNGIAFKEPISGIMSSNYIQWYKVRNIGMGEFIFTKGSGMNKKTLIYAISPVSDYESLQDFEMRTKRFYFDFVPHLINEKVKHGSSKSLKRLQKSYNKLNKILGEEKCNFFRTNNNYEEFKKQAPLLEKAWLDSMPKWARYFLKKQQNT